MQQSPLNTFHIPPRQEKSLFVRLLPWFLMSIIIVIFLFFGIKTLRDNKVANEIEPFEEIFADNISIDGMSISRMTPQEAYQAVYRHHDERVNSWKLDINYEDHKYVTVTYQTLGLNTNISSINKALNDAWNLTHQGNSYQKKEAIDTLRQNHYEASTVQNSEFSAEKLEQLLYSIADNISSLSLVTDAKLIQFLPDNIDPFLIQKEQVGYSLNVQKTKEQILALAFQGTSGRYDLKPDLVMPSVTEAMLRKNLVLRSLAQTEISTRSDPNRIENIRVSTRKINGLVLKPGQEFSFNKTAQERTLENGYYPAEEQVYGYLETGVGGGVCQTSSTVYQAALLADLTVTKRLPHGEPVGYTDAGLDATVYLTRDREIDFKFKNSTGNNLYITARVKQGSSTRHLMTEIKIYGEPFDDGVQFGLKTIKIEKLLPPKEPLYIADTKAAYTIYKDQEVQKSAPKDGLVVETYLQKYINGQLVQEKFIAKSNYPARQEQVWRGIKNPPAF